MRSQARSRASAAWRSASFCGVAQAQGDTSCGGLGSGVWLHQGRLLARRLADCTAALLGGAPGASILMQLPIEHLDEDLWVFGYGSLIWRPGFEHLERQPARLIGAHRALCVFSHVHRGTPERPGLVLGLDFGGACRGVAYRGAAKKRAETIAYLRTREQATSVYCEMMRSVTLLTEPE